MRFRFFVLTACTSAILVLCAARASSGLANAKQPKGLGPSPNDGKNPFITHLYTADPAAHVWKDGRLYVYPSRDMEPARGCDLMDKYHVFSTADMIHWFDHGQILEAKDVSWGRPEGGFMWAPDCAFRNGTYYFYFPHPSGTDWGNTWKIGVATSNQPASGFKSLGFIPGLGGFGMIDPCVLMDDKGQAIMVYGGASRCNIGKLKANMVEIDGSMKDITRELYDYHEGPWLFERLGAYYLVYADNHTEMRWGSDGKLRREGANRLVYARAKDPLGPWAYSGVLLDATDCDTSQGSVVEFKGQWYLFYHNSVLSGQGNLRSICVDKVSFNPDGSMQKVLQTLR